MKFHDTTDESGRTRYDLLLTDQKYKGVSVTLRFLYSLLILKVEKFRKSYKEFFIFYIVKIYKNKII